MSDRMPRYDVRNDGVGPYAVFYCDYCDREYRSSPDIGGAIAQDIGKKALGGFLRNVPLVGGAVADGVVGQDPRYVYSLTPDQLQAHWKQLKDKFFECPTCRRLVCINDWDSQSGYCSEDSPRRAQIAQSQGEQAAGVIKGFADVFGLGDAVKQATEAAKKAAQETARCPKDGTLAAAGTRFCPNCGSPMIQPQVALSGRCPNCGTEATAKFCPNCGTKMPEASPASTKCGRCGTETHGAKFCPNCGNKMT